MEKVQIPVVAQPKPLQLNDTRVFVVNKDNYEEFVKEFTETYGELAFVALSMKDYENLALNIADIKRYLEQQKEIIIYYEKAVTEEPEEKVEEQVKDSLPRLSSLNKDDDDDMPWPDMEAEFTDGSPDKDVGFVKIVDLANGTEDVEEMEIMYQYSSLTMGWCINCHRESNVKVQDNEYYAKIHDELSKKYGVEKLTVAQMGGLECGKCHY